MVKEPLPLVCRVLLIPEFGWVGVVSVPYLGRLLRQLSRDEPEAGIHGPDKEGEQVRGSRG
jgi:hypothetical protein